MSSAIYNIELQHQIRRKGVLPEYTGSLFCQRKPKPITRTGEGMKARTVIASEDFGTALNKLTLSSR